jgi:two-component system sensor histidine kinase/response regulator
MSQSHALIIEDNSKNVQVLGNMLNKEGLTHTDVLDSTLVATVLQELDQIDVVFLDLEMQDLNGYDILEMLRSDSRFASIPIVAYTVHVSEINTAYQLGFHSFLAKPLDSDQFPEQLARILRGERVWGQS